MIWANSNTALCRNIIAGIKDGIFFCPLFGTAHEFGSIFCKGEIKLRLIEYRGYTYYIKELDNKYEFGLLKSRGFMNKTPILEISKDGKEVSFV